MPQNAWTSLSQKGWCNKPTKLQFQSIFNMEYVDALKNISSTQS